MKYLLIRLITTVGKLLTLAIVIDALLSWVPGYNDTVYKIRTVLQKITSPIMNPVRKLMYPVTRRIMIDFSPVIAIMLIEFVQAFLVTLIMRF